MPLSLLGQAHVFTELERLLSTELYRHKSLKICLKKITFIIGFILAVPQKIEHGVSSDRRQSSILAEKLIFNTPLIFSH